MSLTKWIPTKLEARYQARGFDLRMVIEPSTIPGASNTWYWRVIDEEEKVVADGFRVGSDNFSALGPAKSACTRAAKKYTLGRRK